MGAGGSKARRCCWAAPAKDKEPRGLSPPGLRDRAMPIGLAGLDNLHATLDGLQIERDKLMMALRQGVL